MEIKPSQIEPAAFTLGGKIHGVDTTSEVNWRMLHEASVGTKWKGREEWQHGRVDEAATVVYRTEHTVVVLWETWRHVEGEEYSFVYLQAFHFQDGVCVAATARR